MQNTKLGSLPDPSDQEEALVKKLKKSLRIPHISHSGNAVCTNPSCRARMIKSNAILEANSISHRAVMITGKTKIFLIGKSIIAECVCGTRYDLDGALSEE